MHTKTIDQYREAIHNIHRHHKEHFPGGYTLDASFEALAEMLGELAGLRGVTSGSALDHTAIEKPDGTWHCVACDVASDNYQRGMKAVERKEHQRTRRLIKKLLNRRGIQPNEKEEMLQGTAAPKTPISKSTRCSICGSDAPLIYYVCSSKGSVPDMVVSLPTPACGPCAARLKK